MRSLLIILLGFLGTAAAAARHNFLCEDSALDIYPDVYFTCEAMQSFDKGFDTHALELFMRASRWGSKEAQYRVGLMYMGGIGTDTNHVEAAAWLLLANERNNRQITERLAMVLDVLSEDDRIRANGRAAELREEYGDYKALERRTDWVRRMKKRTTGSRIGKPNATVKTFDNSGITADQRLGRLDAYETHLRNVLTTVEYRDFRVIEDDEESESNKDDSND